MDSQGLLSDYFTAVRRFTHRRSESLFSKKTKHIPAIDTRSSNTNCQGDPLREQWGVWEIETISNRKLKTKK